MAAYRGRPLLFGLGNFIFQTEKPQGAYPPPAWQGVIASVTIDGDRPARVDLTPLVLNEVGLNGADDQATRGFPTLAGDREAADILTRLAAQSAAIGGHLDLRGTRGALRTT